MFRAVATIVFAWAAATTASGCGRLGYEPRALPDAAPDAPPDPPPDATPDAPTCPVGTTELSVGSSVCIELVERGDAPWTDAVSDCAASGRRLCADLEWYEGCVNAVGLVDMVDGGFEWVAEESAGVALKRGADDCTVMSSHAVVDPYEYRCCADL